MPSILDAGMIPTSRHLALAQFGDKVFNKVGRRLGAELEKYEKPGKITSSFT
jgi:hypothetical protein